MPPLNPLNKSLIALALTQMSLVSSAIEIAVNGTCSLADAITSANESSATGGCPAGAGGDNTITLQANSTITLTAADPNGAIGGDGGLPLVSSDITIQGNGAVIERSYDPATPDFRLFGIADNANITLTLNSLTLRNGLASTGVNPGDYSDGGAIYIGRVNSLVLNNAMMTNNSAPGSGGAIAASGAPNNTEIIDIEINNSQITSNEAGRHGGAIGLNHGLNSVVVNDSQITGNFSGFSGAGIRIEQGPLLSINDSTISGNSALTWGGGMSIFKVDSISIERSAISSNYSREYGGGADIGFFLGAKIIESSISNNVAGEGGGGIFTDLDDEPTAYLTISQSIISNNTANFLVDSYGGGGLYLKNSNYATIVNSTISGNSAFRSSAMYVERATVELVNTTVSENHTKSSNYGAISVYGRSGATSTVTLSNSVIANSTNFESDPIDCSANYSLTLSSTASWVENFDPSNSCLNGNPVPATIQQGDPGLEALADISSTKGHQPSIGSGLLGAGGAGICAGAAVGGIDQIGSARGTTSCTIGALEDPVEPIDDGVFFTLPVGKSSRTITIVL